MRGIAIFICVLLVLCFGFSPVFAEDQPPTPPYRFLGNVTIGGNAAPDGTVVTTEVAGAEKARVTTSGGKYGYGVEFNVAATTGELATFKVNGVVATTYAITEAPGSLIQKDLAVSSAPPPTGGGGGGGGGGVPQPSSISVTVSLLGMVQTCQISQQGVLQTPLQVQSAEGKVGLQLAQGTVMTVQGQPLTALTVTEATSPPAPPAGSQIISAYDFATSGATFSPNVTLTIRYDQERIPKSVAKKDLYIAYWDGSKWLALSTTVNADANIVSCQLSHFTIFAVIAPPAPPAPAAFSVSNLLVKPTQVQPKEMVAITVSVANTGGTEASYSVVLKINGVKEAEKSVTVAPGKSHDVSFSVTREDAGSYTIDVAGLSSSFTVVALAPAPPASPPPPPVKPAVNWPVLGGIIAAVVVVGLLIFFLARRRVA